MLKWLLVIFLELILAACALVSVTGFLGELNILFEIFSHTRIILSFVLLVLSTLLFLLRRKVATFVSAGFLFLNLLLILPYYAPMEKSTLSDSTKLSILQINVQGGLNTDYKKTMDLVKTEKPHIVALTEITSGWSNYLDRALKDYPYRTVEPRLGGVAVYSKIPLIDSEVRYTGKIKRPRIVSKVKLDGKETQLIFAHPVIPIIHKNLRNEELEIIGNEARNHEGPVIVFGDLNTTPWSCYFKKLLKDGGLSDSQMGFGIQPSWSVRWTWPLFPIDHLLVSNHFQILDRKTLKSVDSDHLPVLVSLQLKKSQSQQSQKVH